MFLQAALRDESSNSTDEIYHGKNIKSLIILFDFIWKGGSLEDVNDFVILCASDVSGSRKSSIFVRIRGDSFKQLAQKINR